MSKRIEGLQDERLKRCSKCKETKSVLKFYKNVTRRDGIDKWCKICSDAQRRIRYERQRQDPEYLRRKRESEERRRQANPEKFRARVYAKLNREKIKKSACERCGSQDRLQMHHHDYSKPYDVETLCFQCHHDHHHAGVIK